MLAIRKRRKHSRSGGRLAALALLLATLSTAFSTLAAQTPPNVLFIISDDLSANALGCYGSPIAETPRLDSLAAEGVRFTRAYCQFPVCGPSRASLLAGLYPQQMGITGNNGYQQIEMIIGSHVTLPEHLRGNGFHSSRVSKLYHMRIPGDITFGAPGPDHPASWDTTFNVQAPEWMTPGIASNHTSDPIDLSQPTSHYGLGFGASFYVIESVTDGSEQADFVAVSEACNQLESFSLSGERFFLAVGLVRPHVPLVAPASDFARFDPLTIPLAPSVPNDLADIPPAGRFWIEPTRGPFNDPSRRKVLQAYHASVAFMDTQVGRLLDQLELLGLDDNTIVVFTSDHGYHLGEHTFWQKLSLHEESARVPLILRGPGIPAATITPQLAELVDLYPTLTSLTGVPTPAVCAGKSLAPTWGTPQLPVRDAAISMVGGGELLRTPQWSFMRYDNGSEELYDMFADPLQFENLANDPAYLAVVTLFRTQLAARLAAVTQPPQAHFSRGDCNGDGGLDISDAISVLAGLFGPPSGTLDCEDSCDTNDDGALDIADAVTVLGFLFGGGTIAGQGSCAIDATVDALDCVRLFCP